MGAGGYDPTITGEKCTPLPHHLPTCTQALGRCLEGSWSRSRLGGGDLTLHPSLKVLPVHSAQRSFFGRVCIGSQRGHQQNPVKRDFQRGDRYCRETSGAPQVPTGPARLAPRNLSPDLSVANERRTQTPPASSLSSRR